MKLNELKEKINDKFYPDEKLLRDMVDYIQVQELKITTLEKELTKINVDIAYVEKMILGSY
jgi:hypothetical protein